MKMTKEGQTSEFLFLKFSIIKCLRSKNSINLLDNTTVYMCVCLRLCLCFSVFALYHGDEELELPHLKVAIKRRLVPFKKNKNKKNKKNSISLILKSPSKDALSLSRIKKL